LGEYEDLIQAAVDPYIAVKDAYYQYRKKQVKQ
jgi:ABC-type transporter lipoprotein component MlaA